MKSKRNKATTYRLQSFLVSLQNGSFFPLYVADAHQDFYMHIAMRISAYMRIIRMNRMDPHPHAHPWKFQSIQSMPQLRLQDAIFIKTDCNDSDNVQL